MAKSRYTLPDRPIKRERFTMLNVPSRARTGNRAYAKPVKRFKALNVACPICEAKVNYCCKMLETGAKFHTERILLGLDD